MSNSAGSIALDLINGDMAAFLADLAPDEIETLDAGEAGNATVARVGATVAVVDALGAVHLHGHGDGVVEARECFQYAVTMYRQEAAMALRVAEVEASLPPEIVAQAAELADAMANGQINMSDAMAQIQAMRARVQADRVPVASNTPPTDRVGFYL